MGYLVPVLKALTLLGKTASTGSRLRLLLCCGIIGRMTVSTNSLSRVTVSKSFAERLRNNSPLIHFGQWLSAWLRAAVWLSRATMGMPRPECLRM